MFEVLPAFHDISISVKDSYGIELGQKLKERPL